MVAEGAIIQRSACQDNLGEILSEGVVLTDGRTLPGAGGIGMAARSEQAAGRQKQKTLRFEKGRVRSPPEAPHSVRVTS